MTWHLEHAVASVQAFSVASQQTILLLDALAPLWRQPTSGRVCSGPCWIASARLETVFVEVYVGKLVQSGVGILWTCKQTL